VSICHDIDRARQLVGQQEGVIFGVFADCLQAVRFGESRVNRKLDATDLQIVDLLLKYGRTSCAEIARHLSSAVSERSVRYRIERLRRNGVIHIGAVVNPQAVGFPVTGDVLIEVASGKLRTIAEQLATLENVSYVAASAGDGDLSIQVYARDNQELSRFVDEVVGRIEGVLHTRTALVPWKLKDVHEWQIPRLVE
jgi:Lrp/AsnC family transcriptional regulator, regulator for asnA, asnC and gidA